MFGRKKKPSQPFTHAGDCKIVRVDPSISIPWSEIERGHWQAVCRCGKQDRYEKSVDPQARLDPLDPSTSRHSGGCEYRDTTDPTVLRAILKVREGADGDYYWWVSCSICDTSWQVLHYAPENAG